jgi:hypothetical protein
MIAAACGFDAVYIDLVRPTRPLSANKEAKARYAAPLHA